MKPQKKFKLVQDLDPWPPWNWCSALPIVQHTRHWSHILKNWPCLFEWWIKPSQTNHKSEDSPRHFVKNIPWMTIYLLDGIIWTTEHWFLFDDDGLRLLYSKCKQGFTLGHPSHSHEWPRQNFSIQCQYNIKRTSGENKVKCHLGIVSWSNTKFTKPTS